MDELTLDLYDSSEWYSYQSKGALWTKKGREPEIQGQNGEWGFITAIDLILQVIVRRNLF